MIDHHRRKIEMTQDTNTASGTADLPEARLFTKKPVTIAALQWTGKNLREVITFTDGPPGTRTTHAGMAWEAYTDLVARDGLKIYTLEGTMLASHGDWIIRGVKGEYYPCKPDIFEATYSPAALAAGPAKAAESVTAPAGPSRFADVIAVQRSEAEADTSDAYMVGLYNGMSMMDANYRNLTDWEPMRKAAESVQEDAALWHWLAEYLVGTRTDLDDEIVASKTINDLRKLVEAAIKQGGKA